MVEVANPSEEDDFVAPERHLSANQNHSSEPDYFSSLEEK
jgi:hypothetical protein